MRDIEMTISSVVRKDGKERIFVGFYDKSAGKEAEAVIPGFIFIKNKGFSEEELKFLTRHDCIAEVRHYADHYAPEMERLKPRAVSELDQIVA